MVTGGDFVVTVASFGEELGDGIPAWSVREDLREFLLPISQTGKAPLVPAWKPDQRAPYMTF